MYSFAARFTEPCKNYHIFIIIMMVAGYLLSFVGFAELISYIIMGYVGLFIVVAVIIKYFKRKMRIKTYCLISYDGYRNFTIESLCFNLKSNSSLLLSGNCFYIYSVY